MPSDPLKFQLYRLLKSNPGATNAELASAVGRSSRQVCRYLEDLRASGMVEVKTMRYRLGASWCNSRVVKVMGDN